MKNIERRLTHIALILLFNLISVWMVNSFYETDLLPSIVWVLILTSVLAVMCCESDRYRKTLSVTYLAIILLLVVITIQDVISGICWIQDDSLTRIIDYYGWEISLSENGDYDSLFLTFSLFYALLSFLLGVAFAANKFYFLWVLIALFPFYIGFVASAFPEPITMLAMALCIIGLIFIRKMEMIEGIASSIGEWILVGVLALVLVVFPLVITEDRFDESVTYGSVRQSVREFHSGVEDWFIRNIIDPYGITGAGNNGKGSGIISHSGPKYTGKTELVVTLPSDSPTTYLRGYVGDSYQDGMWVVGNEGLIADQEFFRIRNTQINSSRNSYDLLMKLILSEGDVSAKNESRFPLKMAEMYVETKLHTENIYAPYCGVSNSHNFNCFDGTWTSQMVPSEYSYEYIYNTSGQPNCYAFSSGEALGRVDLDFSSEKVLDLLRYAENYKEFAKKRYMDVPDDFREVLASEILSSGNLHDKITHVQNYMRKNFSYTLSPPRAGKNEDPIMYFLTKSKKGFCQYYASVGVMMFRMMGVPARYVEGYIVSRESIKKADVLDDMYPTYYVWENNEYKLVDFQYVTVDVPDNCAHAWVEIWIDGYGWYPVEVTTGFGDDIQITEPTKKVEPTPTQSVSPRATPTPTVSGSKTPTPVQKDKATPTPVAKKTQVSEKKHMNIGVFMIPAAILLAVGALVVWYYRKRKLRRDAIHQSNLNAATLALYKEIVKVFRAMGIKQNDKENDDEFHTRLIQIYPNPENEIVIDEVIRITKKAVFSQETITQDEYGAVRHYYIELRKKCLNSCRLPKKWYYVFFRGI